MKLKNFAKKYEMSEDELIYAFKELGYFKNNGEPKSKFINNGLFSDNGDVLNNKELSEIVEEKLSEIKEALNMKQIEQLQETVDNLMSIITESNDTVNSLIEMNENLTDMVSTLTDTVSELKEKLDSVQSAPPKKEKKHREMDMSTRARSLIGKKISGWTIKGDGLEVVATRGDDEIRMAGMKKKEDLLDAIDEYDE